MGTSTNAILAYGYDLDGADGWKIAETGEWGSIDAQKITWYRDDAEDDEGDEEGFVEQALKQLLAHDGLSGAEIEAIGWNTDDEVKKRFGVEFEEYCSGSYPMRLLVAKVITVRRGDVELLDVAALQREAVEGEYDARLARAIAALGITPEQEGPSWLLCSYWDQ